MKREHGNNVSKLVIFFDVFNSLTMIKNAGEYYKKINLPANAEHHIARGCLFSTCPLSLSRLDLHSLSVKKGRCILIGEKDKLD